MSVTIETLARYVPTLILRRFAANPSRIGQEMERVLGVVLFSDLSGFTALTERLAERGPSGAEDLSRLLNAYFSRLIRTIEDHGGDVLKMAGDALVALFRASDEQPIRNAALHAAQCGLAIQETLNDFPAAEGVRLSSKIGIGLGQVVAMHVGGVFDRWELLVAGEPLTQMGHAEHQARPGDVVLSAETWRRVRRFCRGTPVADGCVRLEAVDRPLPVWPLSRPIPSDRAAPALLGYIPAAIRNRLDAGQTGWLSELRRLTVLFVNLPGLNQTGSEDLDRIQQVMRALQESIYRFEGSVNKLSVDEKGVTLIAAMGLPPLAHEDDPVRGIRAALQVRDRLETIGVPCAIGVTTGRAYCGEIGGNQRREYTIIGDVVNLSARLMQAALGTSRPGEVFCDAETQHASCGRLDFEALPPISVKGKARPVEVFRPLAPAKEGRPRSTAVEGPSLIVEVFRPDDPSAPESKDANGRGADFVGRKADLSWLEGQLNAIKTDGSRVVVIEAEAGLGKSSLLAAFVARARRRGVTVLAGAGDAVENATAYYTWRPIVARLLGIGPSDDPETRRHRVLERLGRHPDQARLAPLLDPILALELPDNEATAPLTGKVRADNTRGLLAHLLRETVEAGPTLLVLEDGHWMDSASWSLAAEVAQARLGPFLMVVSTRPIPGPRPREVQALLDHPKVIRYPLGPMAAEDASDLIRRRLSVSDVPGSIDRLIRDRAQGNPLFLSELALAMLESGLIQVESGRCRLAPRVDLEAVALPDNLTGVITQRIDRLSPPQQMTLKVASVIGRLFPYRTLHDIYPIEPERPGLPVYLDALERQDLTLRDGPEPNLSYLFKHVTTQEVAYSLMLYSHRRRLHRRVALWYERAYSAELSPYYPLLAHHWVRAEVLDRAISYLERAGEQSLRGGSPREAARFLEEAMRLDDETRNASALPTVPPNRRARWEGLLGQAYLDMGRTVESRSHVERALRLMGRPIPEGPVRLTAHYLRQIGLQAARRAWPSLRVGRNRDTGSADLLRRTAASYDVLGQLCYYSQDTAHGVFSALRALNLAEGAGPSPELARGYATMCIAASLVPLHPLAEVYSRRALEMAAEIGDPAADAWVAELTGIYGLGVGRWDDSRANLSRAIALNHRLGDWRRWEESMGELGRLEYFQGAYHRGADAFRQLGQVARERGHSQAEVWSRNGLAKNLFRLGEVHEAADLLEHSPTLDDPTVDRADAILGLGFLALIRWRLGHQDQALQAARETLEQIGQSRPIVNYNLEGYAGAAEVLLARWERHASRGGAPPTDLRRMAVRACRALTQFAHVFPIGRPRAWLCRGLLLHLMGRNRSARRALRRSLDMARRLAMPFEQAQAHLELARISPLDDPDRDRNLNEARDLFALIGASADLTRVENIQDF